MAESSFPASPLFCAAVITSAHGIRGDVNVKCFLEDPQHLLAFSPLMNEKGEGLYKLEKIISQKGDVLVIKLEGLDDRNAAEALKGTSLYLSREVLPALPQETFYHQDLIGLDVHSEENKVLGHVHALHNFGAGDLLEIKTYKGLLFMVPFTKVFVPQVDLEKKVVVLSKAGEAFYKKESHDDV